MDISTILFILCGIIVLIFVIVLISSISVEPTEPYSNCYKCGVVVIHISSFYYKKIFKTTNARIRCSICPLLLGYEKVSRPKSHFNYQISILNDGQKKQLQDKGKINVIFYDYKIAYAIKVINNDAQHIQYALKFNPHNNLTANKHIGIYLLENQINHKKYIGQSQNLDKVTYKLPTKSQSRDPHFKFIDNPNDFVYEKIVNCPREFLSFFQAYFVKKYNTTNHGYNLIKKIDQNLTKAQLIFLNCIESLENISINDYS